MRLVTISGLPGSGTSTLCKTLASAMGWTHFDTGQVFRQLAVEAGATLQEYGYSAEADPDIDRQLDARMIELARQETGGCVLEGRLMGWMAYRNHMSATKVWVKAEIETRVQRVSGRDGQSPEEAMAATRDREESERQRYAQHHDIDIGDLSIYDLVVASDEMGAEQLQTQVLIALGDPESNP